MRSHLLDSTAVHPPVSPNPTPVPQTSGLPELWRVSLALQPPPPPCLHSRHAVEVPRVEKATLEGVALGEDPLGWALIHSLGGRRRSRGQPGGEAARRRTCQVSPAAALGPACGAPPSCQRARGTEPTRTPQRRQRGRSGGGRQGVSAAGSAQPVRGNPEPRRAVGRAGHAASRQRFFLPRGPGVARAPTCQPSLPDVLPQQIPGSSRGIPQLLTDGPPELRREGFPFAGHFRSVLITTSGLATATPAWPAAQTPGDSRRPARDARWGLGTRRGRDMGPPPSRAGGCSACAGRDAPPAPEPCKVNLCAPSTSLLLSHFPSLLPLRSALRRSPPFPSLPCSPGLSSAPLLPPGAFAPSLPPSPKPDSLAR